MQQPYIRNSRQRQYQGLLKHSNNASQNNSRWINYNIEKQTFDNADFGMPNASLNSLAHPVLNSWEDQNQNLWGFHIQANSFQIIGMEKEQFGFFPKPQNSTDNWHGYPIMPFSNVRGKPGKKIDNNLLQRWVLDTTIPFDLDDIVTLKKRRRI